MTAPSQQKLKVHGPVVVTANRLSDGAVVYRGRLGVWTTQLEAADVVTNRMMPRSFWRPPPPRISKPLAPMLHRRNQRRTYRAR